MSEGSSGGIGFLGLLTIALLVLKATGYLDISWWIVFAPVWIPCILALAVIIACLLFGFVDENYKLKK